MWSMYTNCVAWRMFVRLSYSDLFISTTDFSVHITGSASSFHFYCTKFYIWLDGLPHKANRSPIKTWGSDVLCRELTLSQPAGLSDFSVAEQTLAARNWSERHDASTVLDLTAGTALQNFQHKAV